MSPYDSRRPRGYPANPVDDDQIGPGTDEWPGQQARRLDDRYRSWRGDRYRESSDDSSGHRPEGEKSHLRGTEVPVVRDRRDHPG